MANSRKRKESPIDESDRNIDWLEELCRMDLSTLDELCEAEGERTASLNSLHEVATERSSSADRLNRDESLPEGADACMEDCDCLPTLNQLLDDTFALEEFGGSLSEFGQTKPTSKNGFSSSASSCDQPQGGAPPESYQIIEQDLAGNRDGQQDARDATSESSRPDNQERINQKGESSSGASQGQPVENEEKERKKHERTMRNRESASLSRQRKKMHIAEKEKQCIELQSKMSSMSVALGQLSQENFLLRQHLAAVCKQTGLVYPSILTMPQAPLANPAFPVGGQLPAQKVPIKRLEPCRPAPVTASGAQQLRNTKSGRTTKRRKQQALAGGTTLLAALLCFVMVRDPFSSQMGRPRDLSVPLMTPTQIAGDQSSLLARNARILQAASEGESEEHISAPWKEELSNSSSAEGLWIRPRDVDTENRALKHLKDIAPVAVFSDYDTTTDQFSPPAPWKSLSALADSVLLPDGIGKTAVCKKEFSFDTSAVANPSDARQQLQRHMLNSLYSFKGRYQALAMPPIGGSLPGIGQIAGEHDKLRESSGCNDSFEDDYIISVMLPIKGRTEAYTSLDKLYVVVLNPNKRYAMYSCGLQKPILV